jgi:hypothetical protein
MRTGDVSVPALTLRLLCTITQCPSEPTLPCTHKKTQWALGSSHHAVCTLITHPGKAVTRSEAGSAAFTRVIISAEATTATVQRPILEAMFGRGGALKHTAATSTP